MTRPMVESRGTCSTCGRVVHVRLDGGLRLHRGVDGLGCEGSNSRPASSAEATTARLAELLSEHYPHPTFGCECTPEDPDMGFNDFLAESWEQHVVALLLDTVFSQVREHLPLALPTTTWDNESGPNRAVCATQSGPDRPSFATNERG